VQSRNTAHEEHWTTDTNTEKQYLLHVWRSLTVCITVYELTNSSIFWNIMPCSPMKVKRRFGGTCRLYLKGRRKSQARNQHATGSKHTAYTNPVRTSNPTYWHTLHVVFRTSPFQTTPSRKLVFFLQGLNQPYYKAQLSRTPCFILSHDEVNRTSFRKAATWKREQRQWDLPKMSVNKSFGWRMQWDDSRFQ
jgi:hypothetical protein